jgi:CHASE1-domain containing sensor protein
MKLRMQRAVLWCEYATTYPHRQEENFCTASDFIQQGSDFSAISWLKKILIISTEQKPLEMSPSSKEQLIATFRTTATAPAPPPLAPNESRRLPRQSTA